MSVFNVLQFTTAILLIGHIKEAAIHLPFHHQGSILTFSSYNF